MRRFLIFNILILVFLSWGHDGPEANVACAVRMLEGIPVGGYQPLNDPRLKEELTRFRSLYLEVSKSPTNPNPRLFLSDKEDENYKKILANLIAAEENPSPRNRKSFKRPEIWSVFPYHEVLSVQDERALLTAYRTARNHDIKTGKVALFVSDRASEREVPEAKNIESTPRELFLSEDQWALLDHYHVPLPGCPLPLSVQIGKIILYHNLRLILKGAKNFSALIQREKDDSLFFDVINEAVSAVERALPFFSISRGAKLSTFMGFRIRASIQSTIQRLKYSIELPAKYWEIHTSWNRAIEYAKNHFKRDDVSPEEVYSIYSEFILEGYKKKGNSDFRALAERRLKKEGYGYRKLFLARRQKILAAFKAASNLSSQAVFGTDNGGDNESFGPLDLLPAKPTETNEHKRDDPLGENFLAVLEKTHSLRDRDRKILCLRNGLMNWEEAFNLLKEVFAGKLDDPKRQSQWLATFISEYSRKSAGKWSKTLTPEIVNKFEKILNGDWPAEVGKNDIHVALNPLNPFFQIYDQLGTFGDHLNHLDKDSLMKRVADWHRPELTFQTLGAIFGVTGEDIRQRAALAMQKLTYLMTGVEPLPKAKKRKTKPNAAE